MAPRGQPSVSHPRQHGVFVRFSDIEWGALQQALHTDHTVAGRRPTLPEWVRDLVVAHASEVLRVEVTRTALRPSPGGAANWKRWRLAEAVRRAEATQTPPLDRQHAYRTRKPLTLHHTGATPPQGAARRCWPVPSDHPTRAPAEAR